MLKAVIFDMDGVIVSTDIYHYRAWKALADRYGLMFDFSINDRLRGISRTESLKIILEVNQVSLSEQRFQHIADLKNRKYRRFLNQLTPDDILPGVKVLIDDLKAHGIKTAVGSSSRNTPKILKRLKLSETFDTVIDGNSAIKSKPDPEIFLACAMALGESPKDCLVIEDALAGIAAAKAAGMTAVGVGESPLPRADAIYKNLLHVDTDRLLEIHAKRKP